MESSCYFYNALHVYSLVASRNEQVISVFAASQDLTHTHTHITTFRMAGECVLCEGPDLKEMSEEELWNLINDNRHRISLGVRPGILIPYLRQARVLTEMDEDEILSSHNLTNRSMRTSESSVII